MAPSALPSLILGSVLIFGVFERTNAIFPKVCAENAGTLDGRCCPVPVGFLDECGGPGWGSCVELKPNRIDTSKLPISLHKDPRLDWPRNYFKHVCGCVGHRTGYDCQDCDFGWTGANCNEKKKPIIRKNALHLTKAEAKQFRDTMTKLKNTPSDMVVPRIGFGDDPNEKNRFVQASIYDTFTFQHFFSVRTSFRDTGEAECVRGYLLKGAFVLDYSHTGSGFLTWHRKFLLEMERELQKASGDDRMALPYWDWSDHDQNCSVCTNNLVGKIVSEDPDGILDRGSAFWNWTVRCPPSYSIDECEYKTCNMSQPPIQIKRLPTGISPSLPKMEDIVFALNAEMYDVEPYGLFASAASFRNCLEGFVSSRGTAKLLSQIALHGQGHTFFEGAVADVPNSPSDPLFYLHHGYVDKLLEVWMRNTPETSHKFPPPGAAPTGHNIDDNLVPFIPTGTHADYFTESTELGYDFDNMWEADLMHGVRGQSDDSGSATSGRLMVLLTCGIVVLAITAVVLHSMYRKRQKKTKEEEPLLEDESVDYIDLTETDN